MKNKLNLFLLFCFFNFLFLEKTNSQCQSDYLELKNWYLKNNGNQWNVNWGSKINDPFMKDWTGIKTNTDGCVVEIRLLGAKVNGSIPSFKLPNLEYLVLHNNNLTGNIPDFQLANLIILNLEKNKLSGSIPDFKLPKLIRIELMENELSGTLPSFKNSPNLETIDVAWNRNISGSIPDYDLLNLKNLYLQGNQLSGQIPNFKLPNLEYLNASGKLSGQIPDFNCPKLTDLLLVGELSGSIPTFTALKKIRFMYLSGNQLTGQVPDFNFPQIERLSLSRNKLSGKLPNFSKMSSIQGFALNDNLLEGEIPNFNFPHIDRLILHNNKFVGKLPNFNFPKLEILSVSNNQLTGTIPSLEAPKLILIDASKNKFDSMSLDVEKYPLLTDINISFNQLTFNDILNSKIEVYKDNDKNKGYTNQDSCGLSIVLKKDVGEDISIDCSIDLGVTTNLYQWYKDNEKLKNKTKRYLEINNLAEADTGNYFCEITNSIATELTLHRRLIKLQVIPKVTHFKITPNPISYYFEIVMLDDKTYKSVKIYDVLGREIYTELKQHNLKNTKIETYNFPAGTYFCSFYNENDNIIESIKFIKIN